LTFPEDSPQEASALPAVGYSSSVLADYDWWNEMSSVVTPSMVGKVLKPWDSRGGVPYLIFERDGRAYIANTRINRQNKGERALTVLRR